MSPKNFSWILAIHKQLFRLQKCPKNWERVKIKERLMTSCDVSWFTRLPLPILVIALCFVASSDVTDCNEGLAKWTKILKVIGDSSTTTMLRICRHLVKLFYVTANHSTSYGKFAPFEDENMGTYFGCIFYTYCRMNYNKKFVSFTL